MSAMVPCNNPRYHGSREHRVGSVLARKCAPSSHVTSVEAAIPTARFYRSLSALRYDPRYIQTECPVIAGVGERIAVAFGIPRAYATDSLRVKMTEAWGGTTSVLPADILLWVSDPVGRNTAFSPHDDLRSLRAPDEFDEAPHRVLSAGVIKPRVTN